MVCQYQQHNHVLTPLSWCYFETFDLAIFKEQLNPDPLFTSQTALVPVLAALLPLPEHFINLHEPFKHSISFGGLGGWLWR